jgi:type VI secretion system protein ImpG
MDKSVLPYYERELRFVRELGAEFAHRFPKVAGRLGITELACADPQVERLFQGFSFLAGRVQQRLDAEFPRFTQQLMARVYPHYLAPTPSMTVVQFVVDPMKRTLGAGFTVERDTVLRARAATQGGTPCEFRTAHTVQLLPIEIESVEYTSVLRDISDLRLPGQEPIKALLRLRLRSRNERFDGLRLSALPLFLRGSDAISARLYEQLITSVSTIVMRWGQLSSDVAVSSEMRPVRPLGFDDEQALLPHTASAFQGYRLLQEYFAFPTRFDFVELTGLAQGMARCQRDWLELILPLTSFDPMLEGAIDAERVLLFATPAINLFPVVCPRIPLSRRNQELHIVPERARPLDYEVHTLTRVVAYATDSKLDRELDPLYAMRGGLDPKAEQACYALERRPIVASPEQLRRESRSHYPGSEVFLNLVEPRGANAATFRSNVRQLGVHALCTNRGLPLLMSFGQGGNDFELKSGVPTEGVRCLVGPSEPRSTVVEGDLAWRLVNHLSLNYLSLCREVGGAEAIRELLASHAQLGDPVLRRQVQGLRGIGSVPVVRPLPAPGPRSFVRGLEIQLECEDQAFAGHGVFTLASVLSAFFAKYASTNSFTETVLTTRERGEVYRFPTQAGRRHML